MKTCIACNTTKTLSLFGKRKASKDGLDCYCKLCRKDYYDKRNYDRKKYQSSYKRVSDINRKLYLKEYQKKNRYKYKDRYKVVKIDRGINDTKTIKKINKLVHRTLIYKNEDKLKLSKDYLGWTKKSFIEKFGEIPKNYHIDHKVPVSWFLKHTPVNIINSLDNLQLLSQKDNLKKSNKFCHSVSIEFFEKIKEYISEHYINQIIFN